MAAAPIVSSSRGVLAPGDVANGQTITDDPLIYQDYATFIASTNPNSAYVYPDGRIARKKSSNPQDGIYVTDKDGTVIPADKIAQENTDRSTDIGIAGVPTSIGGAGAAGAAGILTTGGADAVKPGLDGLFSGLAGLASGGAGVSTQGITDATARSAALSDQFLGAYTNYQNGTAPTISAAQAQQQAQIIAQEIARTQLGPAGVAAAPGPISAGTATAGQASAQQIAATALAAAAQIDPVTGVRHTTVGPTALGTDTAIAPMVQADRTAMDLAAQAELRGQQQGLIGSLQGTIAGTNPSVAALMLRQETERNVANQYALAQAANGMNTGMAQRTAMINAADINQQAIGQKAMLRAQEIAAAQGQLGGVLGGARGQDIDVSGQQARMDQERILANAGFLNTASMNQAQLTQALKLANAGFKNTATTTQAQLDAAEASQDAKATNDRATAQAGLTQQTNITNAGALNDTSKTNATLGTQASIANAGNQTQASIATAGNLTDANKTSAQLAAQVGIANANNATSTTISQGQIDAARALATAQNQLTADSTSAQLANQIAIANANNSTQVGIANAGNTLTQAQIDQKARQDAAANALAAQGQTITGSIGSAQAQATAAAADAQRDAAIIGGLSSGIAALASDERKKTDISDSEAEIAEFMSKTKPYQFKYKDPDEAGAAPGKRYGVMAQDLERSKVGKSLVRDTPNGKYIDGPQAIGAILATLSAMNKRIEGMEGRA